MYSDRIISGTTDIGHRSSILDTKYFRDTVIQAKALTPEAVQSSIDMPLVPTIFLLDEPPLGAAFVTLAPCVSAKNA